MPQLYIICAHRQLLSRTPTTFIPISQVIMDAVELDKITKFGGYPFSLTLRINEKTLSIMLVDKHKVMFFTVSNCIC